MILRIIDKYKMHFITHSNNQSNKKIGILWLRIYVAHNAMYRIILCNIYYA